MSPPDHRGRTDGQGHGDGDSGSGADVDDGRARDAERSTTPASGDSASEDAAAAASGQEENDAREAGAPQSGGGESGARHSPVGPGPGAGLFGWGRTVEVEGERRPIASLLRRGAALAVDLCFALLAVASAINLLSLHVAIDSEEATGPVFALFGLLLVYIVWLRDRGASRPGGGLRFGLSIGRWFLGLRLVPVAGPRRFTRPVTVADSLRTEGETMRILRAVLLGVAASLVALLLLGHAVSRTIVFRAVVDHAAQHAPFEAERGSSPELAGVPSALVVGKTRAYVRVDAEWGERSDPLEFFLVRDAGEWQVAEVRIGEPSWFRDYALSAPDADVPVP